MGHHVAYHVIGPGSGHTEYAATCSGCGWSLVSPSPSKVSTAGPKHVLDAWDREHAA